MKMKKITALTLALLSLGSISLAGCGGGGSNKGVAMISIVNYGGGVGEEWLNNATERFAEANMDTQFGDYVGVEFEIDNQQGITLTNMDTDGYQMYFCESSSSVRQLAQQSFLLDIGDIINEPLTEYGENKTILSKISKDYQIMCQGADGNYYGLPHYEFYPGLTYDVELFENELLYFADTGVGTAYPLTPCKFGQANFISSLEDKKSCGPDGKYGTQDDGLPSSLQELLLLCYRMKNSCSVAPFGLSAKYQGYAGHLISALWSSLAGYEKMQSVYDFTGTLEVVTGFHEDQYLFGTNYIPKPITETISVTEENGYRVYDMVERYYAMAILKIADTEGWFTETAFQGTTHTEEQLWFIFSGQYLDGKNVQKVGMLIDGNYWYNESMTAGNFDQYYALTNTTERRVAWMNLPVTLDTTVTEGNGKPMTLLDTAYSYTFINANIKEDTGLVKACKEFMRFLYTDAELSAFTNCTGMSKAVNYPLAENSDLDTFQKSVRDIIEKGTVLYAGANNQTFLKNTKAFNLNNSSALYKPSGTQIMTAFHNNGMTVQRAFEATQWNSSDWNTIVAGG